MAYTNTFLCNSDNQCFIEKCLEERSNIDINDLLILNSHLVITLLFGIGFLAFKYNELKNEFDKYIYTHNISMSDNEDSDNSDLDNITGSECDENEEDSSENTVDNNDKEETNKDDEDEETKSTRSGWLY
jgi:hypothetical protein